jgi:hypothetical protein
VASATTSPFSSDSNSSSIHRRIIVGCHDCRKSQRESNACGDCTFTER